MLWLSLASKLDFHLLTKAVLVVTKAVLVVISTSP
jgi:hypothetical protein